MARCVDGHDTQSKDYCDVCGMAVAQENVASPQPQVPEQKTVTCPHCSQTMPQDSLFCESCGYDFITGARPDQDLHAELGLGSATGPSEDVVEEDSQEPPQADVVEPSVAVDDETSETPEKDVVEVDNVDEDETFRGKDVAPQGVTDDDDDEDEEFLPPTSPRGSIQTDPWVAEVWVDPSWYTVQESTDPLPPLGAPRIIPLHERALIGRSSPGRNTFPEIDCDQDVGCSRRQAYLTWADGHWYVNDLDSANGTYVGPASGPLPKDPITVRTRLSVDMRIYVGAWTRIVVRPALPEEN